MKPYKIRAGGSHADFLHEILPYYVAYLETETRWQPTGFSIIERKPYAIVQ